MKEKKICKICGKELLRLSQTHLAKHGIQSYREYYELYLRQPQDGFCKQCGDPTKYSSRNGKYYEYCSSNCVNKNPDVSEKKRLTYQEKYGVDNPFQSKEIKEKLKNTNLEKYGYENPSQNKDIRNKTINTCLHKYGTRYALSNKDVRQKIKNTCKENYGVDNPFQAEEIKEKSKQTCLQKYGVENVNHCLEIRKKILVSLSTKKPYYIESLNETWYLRGYEPHFLDYIFSNNLIKPSEIQPEPFEIYYLLKDNSHHVYYPDFYIPKHNLIVEIKSSYFAKRDKEEIECKIKGVLKSGYNFIMIINNNFNEFVEYITKQD